MFKKEVNTKEKALGEQHWGQSETKKRKQEIKSVCHAPAERKDARLILEIWANGLHHLQSSRPLIAVS